MAPVAHTHISFGTNSISENGRQQLDAMLFDGIRITAILHCKLAHQHSISVYLSCLTMHTGVQIWHSFERHAPDRACINTNKYLEDCQMTTTASAAAASFLGCPRKLASCQTADLGQGYCQAPFE